MMVVRVGRRERRWMLLGKIEMCVRLLLLVCLIISIFVDFGIICE